ATDDASAAVAWLRAHASQYHINPNQIFAGGYSAGGVTAYNLAYPMSGAAAAPIAGALVISGYTTGVAHPGAPPVLDIQGDQDVWVPPALAYASCVDAHRVGDSCELVTLKGAGHEIGDTNISAISDRAAVFFANLVAAPR